MRLAAMILTLLLACGASAARVPSSFGSLPAIPMTALDSTALSPALLTGKVVLVVNVASRCGYTPQYAALQALYTSRKDQGLVLLGVPCNQFGGQEPGTAEEIQSFCKLNYGVDFPLLGKQDVNGPDRSELYRFLVGSPVSDGADVGWNFEKFVVGRDGTVRARFRSKVLPDAPELLAVIDAALAEAPPASSPR